MAEFCTIEDVRGINSQRTYDGDSNPTEDQVEEFVRSANARLTGVLLGKGWTQVQGASFPDDEPEAWDLLKQIAALDAAAVAEQAMVSIEYGSEQSGHVRLLMRQRQDRMSELLATGLPGLDQDVPASPSGAYVDMVDDDDEDEREFTMGEAFS